MRPPRCSPGGWSLGGGEARTRRELACLPHLLQGWVCLRTPPFPILGRSQGQPREKKEDLQLRKFGVVLPFLSGLIFPSCS